MEASPRPWEDVPPSTDPLASPTRKVAKQLFRDDCSTAAPSPGMDFESPAASPMLLGTQPRRIQARASLLPSIPSGSDFLDFAKLADLLEPPPVGMYSVIAREGLGCQALAESMQLPAMLSIVPSRYQLELDRLEAEDTAPSTPKQKLGSQAKCITPDAPQKPVQPPLMVALKAKYNKDQHKQVAAALSEDPEAAAFPFWDHDSEPPLCCAVRFGCDSDVIELLLEYGADVNTMDIHGQTPMMILTAQSKHANSLLEDSFFDMFGSVPIDMQRLHRVRELLLKAGAEEAPGDEGDFSELLSSSLQLPAFPPVALFA
jgi:hypothetical protein